MKKIIIATLAAFLLSGPVQAADMVPYTQMPAGAYVVDHAHASLTWKVSHMGLAYYTARFTDFDVALDFDPADPVKSTLNVTVDPASIKTDYPNPEKTDFDKKLSSGKDWFNAEAYPEITFSSTQIEMTSDKTGRVTGELNFLGVRKPMTLDVTFNGAYQSKPFSNVPALGFSATGVLKRSDWGMETHTPAIGDEVTVLIEVELHHSPAQDE